MLTVERVQPARKEDNRFRRLNNSLLGSADNSALPGFFLKWRMLKIYRNLDLGRVTR